jgi:homoserine kinase type II
MNIRAIEELLARYHAHVQPRTPLESLGGAGGLSGTRLWRFRAEVGLLVLREWPLNGPGHRQFEDVHRWLGLTADLDFIPVPIPDRAGRTLQSWRGGLWEIAPWMSGAAEPPPPSLARMREAFSGLAAFHERLARESSQGVSPGLRLRHDAVCQLAQGGFDSLEQAVQRHDEGRSVECAAAVAWLSLARKTDPLLLEPLRVAAARVLRLQPCLRDARAEHFLFEGDRLSGLVDFGAMGVDCVAGDLARLIGEWLDSDQSARREAVAAYERVRPLDPVEASLLEILEASTALLIGERWVRWHFVERRRFDDPLATARGLARGLRQLERHAGYGKVRDSRVETNS